MSFTIAIVGRPNVGKSTFFNRLLEQRKAIVDDVSGVTRDRQYGVADWNGKTFNVIDTGGFVDNSKDVFEVEIAKQVRIALDEADAILFMVDAAIGSTDLDEAMANVLRRSTKPVIRAMVESGKVIWDATDGGMIDSLTLGKGNLAEKIDYSIVDKSQIPEAFAGEYGISNYVYSNVLAYDAEATKGVAPTGWADFFDTAKFPGKRTMCKWIQGQLEFVLMADGVKPADLYPLDVDRAFKKLKPLLSNIIFWEGGAQTQQLFREGEVVMGNIWHTRANLLNKETPAKFKWIWEQNILSASAWSVPKGNPAGKKVFEFINSTLDPAGQLVLLRLMGNGPSNPKTLALMTPEDAAVNPTTKENAASQIMLNPAYYAEHETELQNKYLDFISS